MEGRWKADGRQMEGRCDSRLTSLSGTVPVRSFEIKWWSGGEGVGWGRDGMGPGKHLFNSPFFPRGWLHPRYRSKIARPRHRETVVGMAALPRFTGEVTSAEWACYLRSVYGERVCLGPSETIDLSRFQILYVPFMQQCGLNVSKFHLPGVARPYVPSKGDRCCTPKGAIRLNVGHKPLRRHAAHTNNTWVEVTHCARGLIEAGFWLYALRGSGVFVNIGRTTVFSQHREALRSVLAPLGVCKSSQCVDYHVGGRDDFWKTMHPLCATMRARGFDSVQFSFSETWLLPMELFLTGFSGTHTCGPNAGRSDNLLVLRSGYRATRPLACDTSARCLSPHAS
jgi:hypothetical protein